MELESFSLFSPVHIACLLVCLAAAAFAVVAGRASLAKPVTQRRWRWIIAIGSLASWLVTILHGLHPDSFTWSYSLPLQFCNFANLIGAIAVLRRSRHAQTLLYFWGITLCPWAFLTPSLISGPVHSVFWVFWIYHLFIPVSLAWVLLVDRYRPNWADFRFALFVTIGFTLFLAALNALTGWNYGFVGAGMPGQPSPIDFLGPYPLRILFMIAIGSAIFLLLLLPWLRKREAA